MNDKDREKLWKLHAMLGSSNAGERDNAREAIDKLLRKHRKTWNDLPELLTQPAPAADSARRAAPPPSSTNISSLDLVHACFQDYVALQPHEYVAMALWIHHAHIYQRFTISPRLLLLSPVRGCGKTVTLDLIARLMPWPSRSDNVTAAALYRMIDRTHFVMLLDEVDNIGLALRTNGVLRSVLNSGHRKGGTIDRVIKGEAMQFSTFAPLALAAIGLVPLPLMHRSIVVHMTRAATAPKRRLDDGGDTTLIDEAYAQLLAWVDGNPKIDPNPEMPSVLRNRAADNWRPLIAIADTFGERWGEIARDTAITFARNLSDEDLAVLLLADIRKVFTGDWMHSEAIVAALIALDDAYWGDFTGAHDDMQPRPFRKGDLARLLRPFRIVPQTIWPKGGRATRGLSAKGYYRHQFEPAWKSYCDDGAAPSGRPRFRVLDGKA
jgi:Protein of unknown function (DUF3631)